MPQGFFWMSWFLFQINHSDFKLFLLTITHNLCGPLFFLVEVLTELLILYLNCSSLLWTWRYPRSPLVTQVNFMGTGMPSHGAVREEWLEGLTTCSYHLIEIWSLYIYESFPWTLYRLNNLGSIWEVGCCGFLDGTQFWLKFSFVDSFLETALVYIYIF